MIFAQRCRTSSCKCCYAARTALATPAIPTMVVQTFTRQAAESGIDLFRIFDALNWVENMKVSIETVLECGKLCEAAICYTGDMQDPARSKYDLDYYLKLAKELKKTGAHIIGIKDMAGVCKPDAAAILVKALKSETGLPIHFHTHDASGIAAASVLAAAEAGADAVDLAMDSFSGLTSQPNLGAVAAALMRQKAGDRSGPGRHPHVFRLLGGGAAFNMPRSRATCAPVLPRSICMRCRADSSPI